MSTFDDIVKILNEHQDDLGLATAQVIDYFDVKPIEIVLFCPMCNVRHIDNPPFDKKVHHTHACQGCGFTWRPAVHPTVGVQFLPGFKNA